MFQGRGRIGEGGRGICKKKKCPWVPYGPKTCTTDTCLPLPVI